MAIGQHNGQRIYHPPAYFFRIKQAIHLKLVPLSQMVAFINGGSKETPVFFFLWSHSFITQQTHHINLLDKK
jgi:hypothetical protein